MINGRPLIIRSVHIVQMGEVCNILQIGEVWIFRPFPVAMGINELRGHPGVQKHCRATWTILAIQMCYVDSRKPLTYGPVG